MFLGRVLGRFFRGVLGGALVLAAVVDDSEAQITLDGSLGPAGALSGPNFVIDAALGQTRGQNLFHSFGQFNVLTGQSATFAGPASIGNIFGRVTGGSPSSIDGLLRSSIPGANLYLLNPRGVLFGPNASLDVSGSFHVSTADVLRLADAGSFHANPAVPSVLTVAPPSSFGFLTTSPASISIRGSMLQVPTGRNLSVVGGDIDTAGATLMAPSGRISLTSVASPGDVGFNSATQSPELNAANFARLGRIQITEGSFVDASGDPGGSVVIRGGRLIVDQLGFVSTFTNGDVDGTSPGIDASVTGDMGVDNATIVTGAAAGGRAGDIVLDAGTLAITGGALVESTTFGRGAAGAVRISASGPVSISGTDINGFKSQVVSTTNAGGDAGGVAISAPRLTVDRQGLIRAQTFRDGRAGDVGIILASTFDQGAAGTIAVDVQSATLTAGARIDSSSFGAGRGGDIQLRAQSITLADGSVISATSSGSGNAGGLTISAARALRSEGSAVTTEARQADGGNIVITAGDLVHLVGSAVTAAVQSGQGQGETSSSTRSS
jgi:filamentous hemagglutinin family protein